MVASTQHVGSGTVASTQHAGRGTVASAQHAGRGTAASAQHAGRWYSPMRSFLIRGCDRKSGYHSGFNLVENWEV